MHPILLPDKLGIRMPLSARDVEILPGLTDQKKKSSRMIFRSDSLFEDQNINDPRRQADPIPVSLHIPA